MSTSEKSWAPAMDRRGMIQGLFALFGAGAAASCVREQKKVEPAGSVFGAAYAGQEEAFLERIADILIPATDTPGAVAAGAPLRMGAVLTNWMGAEEKTAWLDQLTMVNKALGGNSEEGFLKQKQTDQIAAVQTLDRAAFDEESEAAPAYDAYKALKAEIATAYYLSEAGATKELRYENVPGEWKACVPFDEIGRTWAV